MTGRPALSASARAFAAGGHIDLAHPVLGLVQLEPVAVAAEGVGQDDVGARLDEAAMQSLHALGMLEVPHFRRVAGDQAHLEQIGAGGAVGEQPGARLDL